MDRSEFELEIANYYDTVFKVVNRILKNDTDSEDVVQNACLKAWIYLHKFEGNSAFSTWLTRIAVNETWNFLDKKKRLPQTDDITEEPIFYDSLGFADWDDPESLFIADESRDSAEEAMQIMPDGHAVALTMREQVGLTYDQIADILDIPVGTVRSRIFRAKKYIKRYMEH